MPLCAFRGSGQIDFLQYGLQNGRSEHSEIWDCDPSRCRALADAVRAYQLEIQSGVVKHLFKRAAEVKELDIESRVALQSLRNQLVKVAIVRGCADLVEYAERMPRKAAIHAKNHVMKATQAGHFPETLAGIEPPKTRTPEAGRKAAAR